MVELGTVSAIRIGTVPVRAVYFGDRKMWPSVSTARGYLAADGTYSNVGGTDFSIQVPAGVQPGDLCILVVGKDQSAAVAVTSVGMVPLAPGMVAGSMYVEALTGPVTGATIDYTLTPGANHSAVAYFFHGVAVGTVGVPGIRTGSNATVTAPGVTGQGKTWALVVDRSQAATVEEQVDTITTSWGSTVGYYEGNPGVNSGAGIASHWLVEGSVGEAGDLTVTFGDASPSAWGLCLLLVEQ